MRTRPSPGSDIDPKLLAKVRGLLAKAESTTFPEEADALTTKAQQLMGRYAIDAAMIDDGGGRHRAEPDRRTLVIDPPYASAKATVLGGVAGANRCQVVTSGNARTAHLFGYPVDLDVVEVLYTSLLLQATAAMTAAGPQSDPSGRSRTRSFRHAFLLAFAHRVAHRLEEATRQTVSEADGDHHGALVPVLAGRASAVERAVADAFPSVRSRRVNVSSPEGITAGFAAADAADIGVGARLRRSSADRPLSA